MLEVDGVKIKEEANVGTLVLPEPTENDAGWYQCLAENRYGVAVSNKTELKRVCEYASTYIFTDLQFLILGAWFFA